MKKQRLLKTLCFLLTLTLLLGLIPSAPAVFAESASTKGTVTTGTKVNVRTGPGTNYSILTDSSGKSIQLENGHPVTVGESVQSEDNDNPGFWYEISFTYDNSQYSGYIYSVYVTIDHSDTDIVISQDFEELIKNLPEGYKDPLRLLHTIHPDWQFKILKTGLDWKTVIDNECVYGRSLTDSTILSQRSTDSSCYNWLTDTYTAVEGSTWFQAARATVEYYMDPRNFLTEENVFQFEALSYEKSTQTLAGVQKILSGSFMDNAKISDGSNQITYAEAYMKAASLSNVSPYHLAARTIQEVGRGGGKGTSGNTPGYVGYYNFYNIGATTGVTAGLQYAKTGGSLSADQKKKYMIPWNSPYKAIAGGALFIGENYINQGQNTLYLEKFDVESTNGLYWHQYMTNIAAAYSEGRNIYNTYKTLGLLDSSLTFLIPVYENMPKENCPLPTRTGSINNHLKSLEVEGLPLTPTFSHDVNVYYIVLGENSTLKEVTVNAKAITSSATVSGHVGSQKLTGSLTTLTVKVTAENGDVHYYTIYIATSADLIPETPPTPPDEPDPPPSSSTPKPPEPTGSFNLTLPHSSWRIWGLKLGSNVSDLISAIKLTGDAAVTVTDTKGENVTSGILTNNMTVTITANGKRSLYLTLLYGDVDGDGQVTAIDLLMIRRNILGTYELDLPLSTAADADRDGKVTAVDLLMVRRQILGTYTINQL